MKVVLIDQSGNQHGLSFKYNDDLGLTRGGMVESPDLKVNFRIRDISIKDHLLILTIILPEPKDGIYYVAYDHNTCEIVGVSRNGADLFKKYDKSVTTKVINVTHPKNEEVLKLINKVNNTEYGKRY